MVPRRTIRVLPAASGATATPPPATSTAAERAAPALPPAAAPPAAAQPAPPATELPSPASQPWPWMIATLLLALSTAFSSWRWWSATRATATAATAPRDAAGAHETALFAALRKACIAGDGAQAEALLPRWGRLAFPAAGVRSASDVARAAQDPLLAGEIERLLASRHGPQHAGCALDALLARLEAVRRARAGERQPRAEAPGALPPLYASR